MANNISDRSILFNGKVITYRLERKRVKNLNMRIKRDGKIFVSANSRISAVRIDEFVISKGDFILSALERFAAIRANEPAENQYIDGEIFYVLGNEYRLKIIKDTKDENSVYKMRLRKIMSNYGSYIQTMSSDFDFKNYQMLKIENFNDMLEIRDTIRQPILMKENDNKTGAYFLIPSNTKILYVYRLKVSDIKKEMKKEM